jgi:anti-sigma-K factor RskA
MDYLSGKLSGDERHEVEKQMADSHLVNDAVEGLAQFKDPNQIGAVVSQVNATLHTQFEKKKIYRRNREMKTQPWVYLAIILILFLAIISFVLIRAFNV